MSTIADDPVAADAPSPDRRPSPGPWAAAKKVLKPLASLQLTVGLFAASMVLVFFGTVAQKYQGIWTVVDQYFWSWWVPIDLQLGVEFGRIFFGLPADLKAPTWAVLPWPGGKLIGGLMFANLLAAHLVRMKLSWKRAGVITLHAGLLLLFVGEFVTREFQVEQQMAIPEGGTADFAIDTRNFELAFVAPAGDATDAVTVVPAKLLRQAGAVSHPDLPVDVELVSYFRNSDLTPVGDGPNPATAGAGLTRRAVERPEVSGIEDKKMDLPSAYVKLTHKGSGELVGTYLVSLALNPQPVEVDGKAYQVELRHVHYYKPFKLKLIDFRFDRYVGTTTAKNYSSEVEILDPEADSGRRVVISMNHPLRYRGEAFFQSSFTQDEKTTVLQVVRNPGWVLPYVSCALVTLGMALHFGLNLGTFLTRSGGPRRADGVGPPCATATAPRSAVTRVIPAGAVGLAVLYLGGALPKGGGVDDKGFDLHEAARLPVVADGRVKPLDTVARVDARLIAHKEAVPVELKRTSEFKDGGGLVDVAPGDDGPRSVPAVKWFFDVASAPPGDPGPAARYPMFRVENDQLWDLFGLPRREGLRYSLAELKGKFDKFDEAAKKAIQRQRAGANDLDPFEQHVLELRKHVERYLGAWQGFAPLLLPPADGREWRSPDDARKAAQQTAVEAIRRKVREAGLPADPKQWTAEQKDQVMAWLDQPPADADPALKAWEGVLSAYRSGDPKAFNDRLYEFRDRHTAGVSDADRARVRFEAFLNAFAPTYHVLMLYVMAGVLTLVGWACVPADAAVAEGFRRAAFWVLAVALAVHTFALLGRMYVMDRPSVFVTNLYSSAVFIGWAAVVLSLAIERLFPIGLGNAVAAALGFGTGVIAHNLALGGDTLEMMQAVLDTNFWLATHVTTVTLGYSATYIAGMVGMAYVLVGAFTPYLRRPVAAGVAAGGKPADLGRVLGQVLYGVVCLAALLSFVGTVLGGIWADQSWGRFWGWDPKENGAVLIVVWNALILHARWCGLVKDRGLAVLALAGNMVTTWSWFGTNQLGVGLHAYGFRKDLVDLCTYVWIAHLGLIGVGLVPARFWLSSAAGARPSPAAG